MITFCGKNGKLCKIKKADSMGVNDLLNTTAKRHKREGIYSSTRHYMQLSGKEKGLPVPN
jgi:hypothetical protein